MDREALIKIILKDRYEEGREIANIVLDYVSKNSDWRRGEGEKFLFKNYVLDALDKAIYDIYGHGLDFYLNDCREREYVQVRQMAMYLFHKETGYSSNEVGEIFGRNHATVLFAYDKVERNLKIYKPFAKDFRTLEKALKKYL